MELSNKLQIYKENALKIRSKMAEVRKRDLSNREKNSEMEFLKTEMSYLFRSARNYLSLEDFRRLRQAVND